jgi:hypothetical protein
MKKIKIFAVLAAAMFAGNMFGQTITANDVTIEPGKTADVTFTITADTKAAIAEFKLTLPEGIAIQFDEDEDDYVYELGSAMTVKTHAATIKKQESGAFYVLVSNSAGKEFKAATGEYLTVTLEAAADAKSGEAVMMDIILGDIEAKQMNTVTKAKFNIIVGGVYIPDDPQPSTGGESTITANNVTIEKGSTADVTFTINADSKAAIAEFKLVLPEGISIKFDENTDKYVYKLGSDMTFNTHAATIKKQESGAYYVGVSNSAGKEFKAAMGDYLTVTLEATTDAKSGEAVMKDIIIGDIEAKQMNTVTEAKFNITVAESSTPSDPDPDPKPDDPQPTIEITDISAIDNVIYIEPMVEMSGTQANLSLRMKNTAEIRGFQFDLYLPEGVTAAKSIKGRIQGSLNAERLPEEDQHNLSISEQEDGAIRFLCSSLYDETFTGNDGEIVTLRVNIAEDMADGDYLLQLKNVKLTETDINKDYETKLVNCKLTIKKFVLGDINNDGVVDVSDYTGVANHIHGKTPEGFNAVAADVDENGVVDVSDYTGIANIIHTGSPFGRK